MITVALWCVADFQSSHSTLTYFRGSSFPFPSVSTATQDVWNGVLAPIRCLGLLPPLLPVWLLQLVVLLWAADCYSDKPSRAPASSIIDEAAISGLYAARSLSDWLLSIVLWWCSLHLLSPWQPTWSRLCLSGQSVKVLWVEQGIRAPIRVVPPSADFYKSHALFTAEMSAVVVL